MCPTLNLRHRPVPRALTWMAAMVALASLLAACDTDDGETLDMTTDSGCSGSAPSCCISGSDVSFTAVCTDGAWVCEQGSRSECSEPPPSCANYNGEVCCEADGSVTDALCWSPSQPFCPSGVSPKRFCPTSTALEFTEDGTVLEFESTSLEEATTQRARFCGSLDPLPDAVDDERTLCLQLELDSDMLRDVSLHVANAVAGQTTVEAGDNEMQAGPWTYTVDEMNDDGIVEAAIVEQSCFCSHYGPTTQSWSGAVRVRGREDGRMELAVELEMTGNYTFDGFQDARTLAIDGSVILDICPQGPMAPLDQACTTEGARCAYGYDPIECGGRTVVCDGGTWIELEHTDPGPDCTMP